MTDSSQEIIISNKTNIIEKFSEFLIYFYFMLTFFEPYLNGILGSITKYYIFFLMLVLLFQNKFRLRLRPYIIPYMIWLAYRFLTLFWTSNLYMFRQHVLSQIGMVALLVVLTSQQFDRRILRNIVNTMWISSFIISFLAMIFGQSYHGVVETRQVLVLFGQEVDPNNQAAFALVGISIAVYFLFYEKKYKLPAIITLFVNTVSMFMTGSRGGLVSMFAILIFVILFNKTNSSISSIFKKLAIFAGVIFVIYFVLKNFIPPNITDRLFDIGGYEGGSERTTIWKNALKLLQEDWNLIFGAGWGDYFGYNGFYNAMHNTYLAMLCDVGIIGFVLFFMPIVQKTLHCIKYKEYLPVMLLIAGFFPCFFLDAINKRFFWNVIIFMLIFVIDNNPQEKKLSYESNSTDK
ncbi:MAG: O-antigen ligase family protein [Christensenellaceae bacterium]